MFCSMNFDGEFLSTGVGSAPGEAQREKHGDVGIVRAKGGDRAMAVSVVFDSQNKMERYIKEGTPDQHRAVLLAGTEKAVSTKSAQMVITDELEGKVSILVDSLQDRPVISIEGTEVMVTAHDLLRIYHFFNKVQETLIDDN